MQHPVEAYLQAIQFNRSTGAATDETAHYSALGNLLSEVGKRLKPRVRCIMGLKDQGAGMPDGGLFTADQVQKRADAPLKGQPPARGVIECKPVRNDVGFTADTKQVTDYWDKYGQVLVTNYRDFLLVGTDERTGEPVKRESFSLGLTDKEFWKAKPAALAASAGDRLLEYLERVLLHAVPLADPKDLAWFLASYARDARARLESAPDLDSLINVRAALEQALGVKFEGAKGDHFFRSTLVQTLFYGVFSAWVLWHRGAPKPKDRFDWEKSARFLHVPILHKLFHELADRRYLDDWKLSDVLDWTGEVLNRVVRQEFFSRFQEIEAVQYFYEPFLQAFDPELRKQLGVWYTPREVVQYMVARVDTVLREELNRPDGLADDGVYILDPCCGTGAYLVEVLRTIAATLREQGEEAMLGQRLKRAATERLFGFELLPAPFVVAHLQLGLFLQSAGVPLVEKKGERAGVFLTNALTGWEPPKGPKQRLLFSELEEERDRAELVKQQVPILVVLGNPPYSGFAGIAQVDEERDLSEAYGWRDGELDDLRPQGQGLNDLYVRFFRMAERCVAERHQRHGVVCFISNDSWLDQRSHPLMRKRYLEVFDQVWIDCLNGDKRKTGKLTPDGKPDPSIFSTEHNREGIQVGTAIALLIRKEQHARNAVVHYRDLWGVKKREELLASLRTFGPRLYRIVKPVRALALPFRPISTGQGYLGWPLLPDLFPANFPGIFTARDSLVVDIDEHSLRSRMLAYFDPEVSHDEMRLLCRQAMEKANEFVPAKVRDSLRRRGFLPDRIIRYEYRPFDRRWLYWESEMKLLNRCRSDYYGHVFDGNLWLAATKQNRKDYDPPPILRQHASLHIIERGANLFPLFLAPSDQSLFDGDSRQAARRLGDQFVNLSDPALRYLNSLGNVADAPHLFHHAIAILHAPAYALENAGALRQDWPRVPLPAKRKTLLSSAELGLMVTTVLDAEIPVPGVTTGTLRPEMKVTGKPARVGGGQLNPAAGELDVTARWAISGKGGVCMPAMGKSEERDYSEEERGAITEGAAKLGLDIQTAFARLGEKTFDIYLNDIAFWKNVPAKVWEYALGGYQVIKKWLSYREKDLLHRGLKDDELRGVTHMARRIAALLLLGPSLDANYEAVKADAYVWPTAATGGTPVTSKTV
jgi:hypothetical protein